MAKKAPKSTGPKVSANFGEIGTTGLKQSGGVIREEFLSSLQGTKGAKVYREMSDNDPIVGSFLFAVEQIMRQVRWKMVPATEDAAAIEAAQFVDSCRMDMSNSWHEFITEILSFLSYGYAPFEILYKLRNGPQLDAAQSSQFTDGRIGWRRFGIRAQDTVVRWELDPEGGVQSMTQRTDTKGEVIIPIDKLLIFRTKSQKNNPEGRSILRNAYRPWYFKKRIEEVEGIGVERDLAGLPVLTTPEGLDIWNTKDTAMVALKDGAETLIRSIRRDEQEGVLLPNGWTLELLTTAGQRQFDTTGIINRYDQRIAMTVLADFILLGHGGKFGSFALAKSKTSAFTLSIVGYVTVIRDIINQHAIPRLFVLNGMPLETMPKLDFDDLETPSLKDLAMYLRSLGGVWQTFTDENLRRHLMSVGNMPYSVSDDAGRGAPKPTGEKQGDPQPPVSGDGSTE